jgi:hypothetical protein
LLAVVVTEDNAGAPTVCTHTPLIDDGWSRVSFFALTVHRRRTPFCNVSVEHARSNSVVPEDNREDSAARNSELLAGVRGD